MQLLAVHTCPLWEDLRTGARRPIVEPDTPPTPGRPVGWCNALQIKIDGEVRMLLVAGR